MMIKKFWLTAFFATVMGLLCTGCALAESLFADKVVTTIGNVTPAGRADAVPADLGMLPPEVVGKMAATGETLVLVDKAHVLDPTADVVDVMDPGSQALDSAISMALGGLNTVFPGVAALEGLGLLFSKRKRKHYGAAVKAAVPGNGKMELKDAVMSLGKAIGAAHSSDGSKKVFEEEEKKPTASA